MFQRSARSVSISLLWLTVFGVSLAAAPPRILLVVAHPDDELLVAATIYRLAVEQGATVDQCVITNGEGGYRYATLAEKYYGLKLTDEVVGRRALPDIRKRELLAAGRILGIRAHYLLDEPDIDNTADPNDVLHGSWNTDRIVGRITELLSRERYDFLLVALPRPDIGGHHLAATLLALRAVAHVAAPVRPVVLGAFPRADAFTAPPGSETAGFSGAPGYDFDRTVKFGFHNALDYQIIANWVIAEHKSQGLYQTQVGQIKHEYLWVFDIQNPATNARAGTLFQLLAR